MDIEAKAKSREEIMEALFIRLQELPTEWLEETVEKIRNYDAKVDIEQVAALMFLCGKKFADEIQSAASLVCQIHPAVEETYIIGTDALRQQHLAWYKAELERRSNAPAADPRDDNPIADPGESPWDQTPRP